MERVAKPLPNSGSFRRKMDEEARGNGEDQQVSGPWSLSQVFQQVLSLSQ